MIDDGLGIIRKLWDAGLAHRDIKPANLLVREGRMLLIDVAFVQARPSPWRQAVDLANMMLCLALRSDPELVYERALRQFSVEEITEGFAAARGPLRRSSPDAPGPGPRPAPEFIRLLPTPPQPVSIQRWSARRVGLLAPRAALGGVRRRAPRQQRKQRHGPRDAAGHRQPGLHRPGAAVAAGSAVPSASRMPCIRDLPVGWTLAEVAVNDGRSVLTLNHDRAGVAALVSAADRRLRPGRGDGGAVPDKACGTPADRSRTGQFTLTWYDQFRVVASPAGCI